MLSKFNAVCRTALGKIMAKKFWHQYHIFKRDIKTGNSFKNQLIEKLLLDSNPKFFDWTDFRFLFYWIDMLFIDLCLKTKNIEWIKDFLLGGQKQMCHVISQGG